MLTENSQNLLLKFLEDTPETTIFILCTTKPYKLLDTVRSRCIFYELRGLGPDDVLVLTTKLLKRVGSTLPADRLTDALIEEKIDSPRLICQAVEKYIASEDVKEACKVEAGTGVDVRAMTYAVTKGDWDTASSALQAAAGSDIRGVRSSLVAYLNVILLESKDFNERNKAITKAIMALSTLDNTTDQIVAAALAATLYSLCEMFSKYRL
jgi:DNA polymerase III gamma/tau subunit